MSLDLSGVPPAVAGSFAGGARLTGDAPHLAIHTGLRSIERLRLPATTRHEIQVGILTERICARLGFSPADCAAYRFAAELHDIGKLVLPDAVLQKQGRLTAEEYRIVQQHAPLGHAILSAFGEPGLHLATQVALSHHERWDGSGYPEGRRGEDIPIGARVVAVCDVYSALREWRPYKQSLSHAEALALVLRGDPTRDGVGSMHFDPALVRLLMEEPALFDIDYQIPPALSAAP